MLFLSLLTDPASLNSLRQDFKGKFEEIPFKIKAKGHELINPLRQPLKEQIIYSMVLFGSDRECVEASINFQRNNRSYVLIWKALIDDYNCNWKAIHFLCLIAKDIRRRLALVELTQQRLTQGKMSLADFASGHEYFGLHFQKDKWVFREWAPNATAIYLIGDFSGWAEKEEFALKKINNGVWEIKLAANKLAMVICIDCVSSGLAAKEIAFQRTPDE